MDDIMNDQEHEMKDWDHRKLGPALDLFHFEEIAPGSVFWHKKGWALFQNLIAYLRNLQEEAGYDEINTPDMMTRNLWEISGHWQNYHANMFTIRTEDEKRDFALKPMNCPGHMMVYNQGIKSYRDLPIRYSEFGKVHRYEPSGALHGLMRVRSFTQDDAHIFCTPEQLLDECIAVNNLILKIYKDFGFKDVKIKLSTRPENSIGTDESWELSENALKQALEHLGQEYSIFEGEGAFYGPKLEYVLTDTMGRDWQCGTLQVDFNLPGEDRFNATYVDKDGKRKHPVMLHRAMFGSLERFFGILLEHYKGNLPFWLQPTQLVLIPINQTHVDFCYKMVDKIKEYGIRCQIDSRDIHMNTRISEVFSAKTPAVIVVGNKEVNSSLDLGLFRLRFKDGKELADSLGELMYDLKAMIVEKS
jgi:threonyl-tRNA synthetase